MVPSALHPLLPPWAHCSPSSVLAGLPSPISPRASGLSSELHTLPGGLLTPSITSVRGGDLVTQGCERLRSSLVPPGLVLSTRVILCPGAATPSLIPAAMSLRPRGMSE